MPCARVYKESGTDGERPSASGRCQCMYSGSWLRPVTRRRSGYVFGIVVAASDETPIGRASATLQVQLPALYPEHRFQFLGRKDLKSEEAELLFQVLVAEVRDVTDDEVVSEMASPDLVQTLQNAVDGIVAAAKIRNVN